ncbi:SpoIIE family protein phosphatase/ATP-binding protein [Streptomyces pinistramenti]|uniref:SpoIIE family protein phosphatase/ATP-binding protein n=1 Tax=Streptomyces pinistramenti TaxID=2884812 RepID=UPI001D099CAB|nr:SpoIIE family protein phosphatase/ATP-binding protein [Streptomyces pinistramenti]MCB5906921.1 SpoIIE family protein phosphatase [Streptomyces pinistramenti]
MRKNGHRATGPGAQRPFRFPLSVRSLAGRLMLVQLVLVVVLVTVAALALVLQSHSDISREAQQRSRSVATTFAQAPGMVQALDGPHPTAVLQPRAERVRREADVDFVVVLTPQGIRYTHPDPQLIGERVVGGYKEALHGTVTRTLRASTGVTVTSITPVIRGNGSVAGLVSVGITIKRVQSTTAAQLPVVLGGAGVVLALSAAGTVLVGRRLRRQTHGLGPAEMTRMYEHHDAVLHSVREGVLIMDADHRLVLTNDEARRLLDLGPDAEGRLVTELGLEPQVVEVLTSRDVVSDAVCRAGDRLLVLNMRLTDTPDGPRAGVATLRDTTELRVVTGRAEAARERLRLLHDAGARVGTTLDVRRTSREMAEVAVPRFADLVTVELADPVVRGEEPAAPDGLLRRTAVSGPPPRGDGGGEDRDDGAAADGSRGAMLFPTDELLTYAMPSPQAQVLHSGQAMLVPDLTGADAWPEDFGQADRIRELGLQSLISVPVRARGRVLGVADFWRTAGSAPFDEDDLALAEELVGRAAVSIDNARRYTREHATAVTLQRSLLPGALPEQDAVDAAYRYLPAQAEAAGVGGDWFDVIPLPGARVALVVGDVVGHGLHAAATMGRLRTAVHNFSALDLPPAELLGYLDELVTRIDDTGTAGTAEVSGATCLYAVYDPASGRCTMASNGHPGPALVRPDGTVSFPEVPVSPPLGLGGEPFDTLTLELPEGSRLVLFTNGLIADRQRDLDTGFDRLREVLAGHPGGTPDDTCRFVLDSMVASHPGDDIALLVAVTRRLDSEHIAEWAVPSDPAAVAPVRAEVAGRLGAWGLAELTFATELILSELVTNAIRYGTGPVRVRLMRARSLICEVSDGSPTAPHLRRAAMTDEGGRGLYLVSRFAERWGTRYPDGGKVVWTEQSLEAGALLSKEPTEQDLLDQWDDDPAF